MVFLPEKVFSNSSNLSSKYPRVSSSETDALPCYMQTEEGTTLNLTSLCGNYAQVVISNLQSDGDILMGHVENKTDKTVRAVRVNYETLGENGTVIAKNFAYTEPSVLAPGQSASFQTYAEVGDGSLRATSVEWDG
jgi:hypothetical protein